MSCFRLRSRGRVDEFQRLASRRTESAPHPRPSRPLGRRSMCAAGCAALPAPVEPPYPARRAAGRAPGGSGARPPSAPRPWSGRLRILTRRLLLVLCSRCRRRRRGALPASRAGGRGPAAASVRRPSKAARSSVPGAGGFLLAEFVFEQADHLVAGGPEPAYPLLVAGPSRGALFRLEPRAGVAMWSGCWRRADGALDVLFGHPRRPLTLPVRHMSILRDPPAAGQLSRFAHAKRRACDIGGQGRPLRPVRALRLPVPRGLDVRRRARRRHPGRCGQAPRPRWGLERRGSSPHATPSAGRSIPASRGRRGPWMAAPAAAASRRRLWRPEVWRASGPRSVPGRRVFIASSSVLPSHLHPICTRAIAVAALHPVTMPVRMCCLQPS